MVWKLINNTRILPIYEINHDGLIRNTRSGKLIQGDDVVTLKMYDNSAKHFTRKMLVRHVFELSYPGTWKPLVLPDIKTKIQYDISYDGRLRKQSTGVIIRPDCRFTLTMEDGSVRTFNIRAMIQQIFHPNQRDWKPIVLPKMDIKPIYEMTKDGVIRNTETGHIHNGNGYRIDMLTTSGKKIKISKHVLMKALYRDEDDIDLPFSEDVIKLMNNVDEYLKTSYGMFTFTITKSNVVDMFTIQCDKFKWPLSIKKEYEGMYAIRTGKRWNDPLYHGYKTKSDSHTYKEYGDDDIMTGIISMIHNKIYNNPTYKDPRPYMYKSSITEEECGVFCKEFVNHGFRLEDTVDMCRDNGMNITRAYARKIVTKQRFQHISDLYFEYNGTSNDVINSSMFTCLITKGE